jgi:hypothetical protein
MRNLLELLDEPIGAASDPPTHLLEPSVEIALAWITPFHWRLNDGNLGHHGATPSFSGGPRNNDIEGLFRCRKSVAEREGFPTESRGCSKTTVK